MKTFKPAIIALLIISGAFGLKTENYTIDPKKTTIQWTGYAEAGNYAPTGTIQLKVGNISFTGQKIAALNLVIDMKTIAHENKDLQEHLKNDDFFGSTSYPEATFVMTSIKDNCMNGKLTIKNIIKPISFPFTITKQQEITLLTAKLKVDRTLFNIKYNSSSYFQDLGSYAIKNTFDLHIKIQLKRS
jgi:polyisoprenoid-binding protein YceI